MVELRLICGDLQCLDNRLVVACVQVISCVTANQECINDIAASEVMPYLLMLLQMLPQCQLLHHYICSIYFIISAKWTAEIKHSLDVCLSVCVSVCHNVSLGVTS